MTLLYQNCAPIGLSDKSSTTTSKAETDNGGPYSGMAKIYQFYNSVAPCNVKDLKGAALPNLEILFKPGPSGQIAPHLARENCADITTPSVIAASDIEMTPGDTSAIRYQKTELKPRSIFGDFDVVKASCPVGRTEIANAVRTNLFTASLDWTVPRSPGYGWNLFEGIGTQLHSTIQSMPAYLVHRNDGAFLELWRRAGQYVNLKPNTPHSLSFVIQAGSVSSANVHIYRSFVGKVDPSDETALVNFDLNSGNAIVSYAVNIPGVSATMTPFAGGYLCTIYFTTSGRVNAGQMDIGVSSATGNSDFGKVGDSIVATAAQLVEVNEFCQ